MKFNMKNRKIVILIVLITIIMISKLKNTIAQNIKNVQKNIIN